MNIWCLLKYLGYGWLILIAAIIANLISKSLGLITWYDFLLTMPRTGISGAILGLSGINIIFLFVLYPGIFGLIIYRLVKYETK